MDFFGGKGFFQNFYDPLGFFRGGDGGGDATSAFDTANAFNASEAQKQRDFEVDFFQHRHQWEVGDLRAAGLNPILSAGGQPPVASGQSAQASTNPYAQQPTDLSRLEFGITAAKAISDIFLNKTMGIKNLADAGLKKASENEVKNGYVNLFGFHFPMNSPTSSSLANSGRALSNLLTTGGFADAPGVGAV